MKTILRCKTSWAAVTLPLVGWLIQWKSGGVLPLFVQTWGPALVAIGIILLRRMTVEPCLFCGKVKTDERL